MLRWEGTTTACSPTIYTVTVYCQAGQWYVAVSGGSCYDSTTVTPASCDPLDLEATLTHCAGGTIHLRVTE